MKNNDYWKKRFKLLEEASNKEAVFTYQQLETQFIKAQKELEALIQSWYSRFANNNQINMAEARNLLNTKELAEFKWDVQEYIKHGKRVNLNSDWMKQLENASAKFHISRLEALKIQTQHSMEVLYGNQLDSVDSLLKKTYLNGYYHTAYEIHKGLNIGWDISGINNTMLSKIVSKPWAADGSNFSKNIWSNRSALINEVHTQLTQTVLLGKSPDNAIKAIVKKFGTNDGQKITGMKFKAARLVMTESAYFSSLSQKDAFKELNVERFEVVETLDGHTCPVCGTMDGTTGDMMDFEPGVTAPPFHPFCRGCVVPHFDDNFGERAARNKDGETYYVSDELDYTHWKENFVDNGNKSGESIDNSWESGIIKSELGNFKTKLRSDEDIDGEYYTALKNKFSQGSDDAKKAFNKFVPHNSVVDSKLESVAFYDTRNKKISMNYKLDLNNERGVGATWFHEHGHMIDDMAGHLSENKEFNTLLLEDYRAYMKSHGKKHSLNTFDKVQSSIGKDLKSMREHSAVSDLLNAISKGGIKGVAGHSLEYWMASRDRLTSEAFAHMFEAQFDKVRYGEMKKYFPMSLRKFESLLGGIL